MDATAVFAKVKQVAWENIEGVDEKKITLEASLVKDLGADAMDTLEFIMGLEDELKITIPETDTEKLVTVKDVVDYLCAKTREV